MKYLKALSLAAVAALALMAFVGVSSASAKVCSTSGEGLACASGHGKEYTGPIVASLIETTGGAGEVHAVLTSGFIQVTCTTSTVSGTITNAATGTGDIEGQTFAGCTSSFGTTCTANTSASAANKWHSVAVTETAPNGRMEVENITGTFTCPTPFGTVVCRYKKAKVGAAGEIKIFGSDTTPTIEATEVPLEREAESSSFCSTTAKWDGRYEITSPSSLFLT